MVPSTNKDYKSIWTSNGRHWSPNLKIEEIDDQWEDNFPNPRSNKDWYRWSQTEWNVPISWPNYVKQIMMVSNNIHYFIEQRNWLNSIPKSFSGNFIIFFPDYQLQLKFYNPGGVKFSKLDLEYFLFFSTIFELIFHYNKFKTTNFRFYLRMYLEKQKGLFLNWPSSLMIRFSVEKIRHEISLRGHHKINLNL